MLQNRVSLSLCSELSAKALPLWARLPAMWSCPPGPPFTSVYQSHLPPWLQAGRSPAPGQISIPVWSRPREHLRLCPTRPLTQAQFPELRVRPGPLTCSPSPDTLCWFSSYIWAPVSVAQHSGPDGLEAALQEPCRNLSLLRLASCSVLQPHKWKPIKC